MYIISKHRDYYDKVAGQVGIDKTLIFKRTLTEFDRGSELPMGIKFSMPSLERRKMESLSKMDPDYEPFIIGFCGKIYVGYKFIWNEWVEDIDGPNNEKKCLFLYDVDKIIAKITKGKTGVKKKKLVKQLKDMYTFVHGSDYENIFREYKVPCFHAEFSHSSWNRSGSNFKINSLNTILEQYKFVKVFDPFTAFQEVAMFMGGYLGENENEQIKIADKYRMEQRGLDKTSFRQAAPGHKKEQRRLNKVRKRQKKEQK